MCALAQNRSVIAIVVGRTFMMANYIGDASFAFTGSLAAGLQGMDLLGCNLVGFITALGGGSLAATCQFEDSMVLPIHIFKF